MSKKKIRKLMNEAGWSLMLSACLFIPAAIAVPDVRAATNYLQAGMLLIVIGAIIDISKAFVR